MTDGISRDDPRYWGTPIDKGRANRAAGADRLQIGRNQTPSLAWDILPTNIEEQKIAIQEHIQMRLQIYLQLLIYVNQSELRFRKTSAANQVTSGAANEDTEEAHPHLLAGVACTTRAELAKGIKAVWVQLAEGSHLGNVFQMTHRLWSGVNRTDTALESGGTGASGITLREFALEGVRLVADGLRTPSQVWKDFLDAHKVACKGLKSKRDSFRRKVLLQYRVVLRIYIGRLQREGIEFVKSVAMSGDADPDERGFAEAFQAQIGKELRLGEVYAELVKHVRAADGAGRSFPEQANAFLSALIDREAPRVELFSYPVATTGVSRNYVSILEESEEYKQRLAEEIEKFGALEVVRKELMSPGKKEPPLKCVGVAVLQTSAQQLDCIVLEAARRLVGRMPPRSNVAASTSALSCYLNSPHVLAHFAPSSRGYIEEAMAKLDFEILICRKMVEMFVQGVDGDSVAEFKKDVLKVYERTHGDNLFLRQIKRDLTKVGSDGYNGNQNRKVASYKESINEHRDLLQNIELQGKSTRKPLLAPRSLFNDPAVVQLAKDFLAGIEELFPQVGPARRRLSYGSNG